MRLLMRTTTHGVETDMGKFAVVALTKELMETIADRRAVFELAYNTDRDADELTFHDRHAHYYDDIPGVDALDVEDYTTMSDDVALPEEVPTEIDRMIISEHGISWSAGLKHMDFYVYTTEIHFDTLQRLISEGT